MNAPRVAKVTSRARFVSLATKVDRFVNNKVKVIQHLPGRLNTHWDRVQAFLTSRISEFHRSAIALYKGKRPAPIAIIVLARAQYESLLDLMSLLSKHKITERDEEAKRYLKFGEYEHVRAVPNSMDDCPMRRKPRAGLPWALEIGRASSSESGIAINGGAEKNGIRPNMKSDQMRTMRLHLAVGLVRRTIARRLQRMDPTKLTL